MGIAFAAACGSGSRAERYVLPTQPGSIVVVTDRVANPRYAPLHAQEVANVLRHFTARTRWMYIDQLNYAAASGADAVVYLGDNGSRELSRSALSALRGAKILVVTRFHVHQLHDANVAFQHVREGRDVRSAGLLHVAYRGTSAGVRQADYVNLTLQAPARSIADIKLGATSVPYIVQDGNATFINGTLDYDRLEARPAAFGQAILVSDALNDALHAGPLPAGHFAMLRLEDVSVQTPALNLRSIVDYLNSEGIPYGVGVIPDQLVKGQTLRTLDEEPELVSALTFAQSHGGTIILHGLHHSFNSPEDFEFWDAVRRGPLPQDSAAWMDQKLTQGLQIEHANGLRPKMWETPHYSASDVDYTEVSRYLSAAWEQRRPNGWLPWPLQRDVYGATLLPENLGYVAVDGTTTVDDQLAIAKLLLACRGCIAAGFLHPSTVSVATVQRYVNGLRELGYTFTDPAEFLQ